MGNGTFIELPVIADVDYDNQAEIVVAANNYFDAAYTNGILVFGAADNSWFNTRKIWNQCAYHITNINDDFSIPQAEENSWSGANVYRSNVLMQASGCHDLSASYIRVDTAGLPGSVAITVRIGNGGLLPVSSINIALYDGDPAAGGTLLGVKSLPVTLETGTYSDLAFVYETPLSGTHNLYAVADDDGQGRSRLREIDEENNKTSLSVELP